MAMNEVDKAERNQALKAFLIPSGLFVACLFNAAGIYIVYAGNAVGMVFLVIGLGIIIAGLFMSFTFHNKHRVGARRQEPTEPEPYMPPGPMRVSYRALAELEKEQAEEKEVVSASSKPTL